MSDQRVRIEAAWQGRISGCQLGKPVELTSMQRGYDAMIEYLQQAEALPLRDYVPAVPGTLEAQLCPGSCRGQMVRSEPDDDINYTVLALMMLEARGAELETADVGRAWLRYLPAGVTYTAERAAYQVLLAESSMGFTFGAPPDFDLARCADNEFNDWIGAQIRADMYGWVCPGNPELAADLARRDAELSHRDEGVYGAMFVAAMGAVIPEAASLEAAAARALECIPGRSDCAAAVRLARELAGSDAGPAKLRAEYGSLSPVHTVNNLALVVWALLSHADDFSAAIGEAVTGGWDTDCNGATVGGLWGLQGKPIPRQWTAPWQGRVATQLAGVV